MGQIFHPSTNTIAKVSIFGGIFIIAGIIWAAYELNSSAYVTQQDVAVTQPVQFSHQHHSGGIGIDCRYCHGNAEKAAFAGIPPTKTCMNCHSQIWLNSAYLEPVRASYRDNRPIEWVKVHDLPQYAYFNHSIHVTKGIGCSTCHGEVDRMPLVWQNASLQMQWCLECHRAPEKFVRPKSEIYNMRWQPPADQEERGRELVREYRIRSTNVLTSCSTCHR